MLLENKNAIIYGGVGGSAGMGSTGPADAATEAFMRYLAAEVGPQGVRVLGIHRAGSSRPSPGKGSTRWAARAPRTPRPSSA